MKYKALVVKEIDKKYKSQIEELEIDDLHKNEVLIQVHYSSLNYKDALSATGNKGVTRNYPHTPGIDSAGIVVSSKSEQFSEGDKVIVTGYDLGMNTAGGFGQYISVPAEWVVRLPEGLTLKEAMIIGTAGFTAGISLTRLSELVKPTDGKIIVTGATGGVGSMAVALLNHLQYDVVAVTGKASEHQFLRDLGVKEIISRDEFMAMDKKPILSSQFAGGIDTVGGVPLENIIKSLKPLGAVTTCGSVSATHLDLSVFPFILRGISLIGVSSQNYPMPLRQVLWHKLANEWKLDHLESLHQEIALEALPHSIEAILSGQIRGRTVVKLID